MKILLLILVIVVIVALVALARRGSGRHPLATDERSPADDLPPSMPPEDPIAPTADLDGPGYPEDDPEAPPWDRPR